MELEVQGTPDLINFKPATVEEEILQNVRTIITTVKGSVPFDRSFGIDASGLDLPGPVLQAQYTAQIVDAVSQYEPRVNVVAVNYTQDDKTGSLIPNVKIQIKEGVTR